MRHLILCALLALACADPITEVSAPETDCDLLATVDVPVPQCPVAANATPLRLSRSGNVWTVYSTFNESVAGFELTFAWRGKPPIPEKGQALKLLASSELAYNEHYAPNVIKLLAIIVDPAECLAPDQQHEIVRFVGPGRMDWVLTVEYGDPDVSIVTCDGFEYPQTEAAGPGRIQ